MTNQKALQLLNSAYIAIDNQIEIVFTTSVRKNNSLKEFLKFAPVFDNLISTLRYE